MHKKIYIKLISIIIVLSLSACAGVKLTHGGEKARVLSSGEVANCQKRGATTVKVKPTLMTVPRQPTVVAKELQILARNSAVNMGGDTVTPISKIDNGQQTFAVYRCIP
jgi:hypothetical protein